MKAKTVQAYLDAKKQLDQTARYRYLRYGPDSAKFLLLLFDAVGDEIEGNSINPTQQEG